MSSTTRPPCIGLALGSGSARGWSHIGVIRALNEAGIFPQVVCGTSIGAVIGAVYAAAKLDGYEAWVRSLDRRKVYSYVDLSLRGGLIKAQRVFDPLAQQISDQRIEDLPIRYAAVATDLYRGVEVRLTTGPVLDAVRASIALPGIVTPFRREGRWLVDGGVINPVPVSVCRALGADLVIAVDLNTALLAVRNNPPPPPTESPEGIRRWMRVGAAAEQTPPAIYEVVVASLEIAETYITRSRLSGDPPDMLVAPRLPDFSMFDFDRAEEAIAEGHRATVHALASAPSAILPKPAPAI